MQKNKATSRGDSNSLLRKDYGGSAPNSRAEGCELQFSTRRTPRADSGRSLRSKPATQEHKLLKRPDLQERATIGKPTASSIAPREKSVECTGNATRNANVS